MSTALEFYEKVKISGVVGDFKRIIEEYPTTITQEDWDKLGSESKAEYGDFDTYQEKRKSSIKLTLEAAKVKLQEARNLVDSENIFVDVNEKNSWLSDFDNVIGLAETKISEIGK